MKYNLKIIPQLFYPFFLSTSKFHLLSSLLSSKDSKTKEIKEYLVLKALLSIITTIKKLYMWPFTTVYNYFATNLNKYAQLRTSPEGNSRYPWRSSLCGRITNHEHATQQLSPPNLIKGAFLLFSPRILISFCTILRAIHDDKLSAKNISIVTRS